MRLKSWIIGTVLAVALWLLFAATLLWVSEKKVKAEDFKSGIHASMIRPETEDWFSSYPASHRLIHGQDPVEPEGNPTHDPDKMECGNQGHEGKMIKCECHKWRSCDEPQDTERKSCQNYCWAKQKCKCMKECE